MKNNAINREFSAGGGRLTERLDRLKMACPDGRMDLGALQELIEDAIEDALLTTPEKERHIALCCLALRELKDLQGENISLLLEWQQEKLMDAGVAGCVPVVLGTMRRILDAACSGAKDGESRLDGYLRDPKKRELIGLDPVMQQLSGVLFAAGGRMAAGDPPLLAAAAAAAVMTAETGCRYGLVGADELAKNVTDMCEGRIGAQLDERTIEAAGDAERAVDALERAVSARRAAGMEKDVLRELEQQKQQMQRAMLARYGREIRYADEIGKLAERGHD